MKSFIAALVLFFLILIGVLVNSLYVCSTGLHISEYAQLIESSDEKLPAFLSLKEYWENRRSILRLSVAEAKIERMNELVISLYAAIDTRNSSEIQKICSIMYELSEDISLYEKISLHSIF